MAQKYAATGPEGRIYAFYDAELSPPPEGVTVTEISDDDWQMLLNGQSDGEVMTIDADGDPALEDPPPLSDEVLGQLARAWRDERLAETDWLMRRHQDESLTGSSTSLTTDQVRALAIYRQALRNVPQQSTFPTAIEWPDRPQTERPATDRPETDRPQTDQPESST